MSKRRSGDDLIPFSRLSFRRGRVLAGALALAIFFGTQIASAQNSCESAFAQKTKAEAGFDRGAGTVAQTRRALKAQLVKAGRAFGLPDAWIDAPELDRPRENSITGTGSTEIPSLPDRFRWGERFWLNFANDDSPVEIADPIVPTGYPGRDAVGDIATVGESRFRVANVGSRQFHDVTKAIDALIERHYAHSTEVKQVWLPIAEEWRFYHSKMHQLQSTTSLMTTQAYKARKPYLVNEDLENLHVNDLFEAARNEYVVVMNEIGKPVFEMTLDEYKSNLLAAMRLARAGEGHGINDIDMLMHGWPGELPCLSRLSGQPRDLLQKFFAQLGARGIKVAEMTRFSRFQKLPPDVLKMLILRMFEFSKHPTDPVDVFVMEVDAVTRRLFADYGLEELIQLPSERGEAPEYIMTVDARTPQFARMLERLRAEVAGIVVEQAAMPKTVDVTPIPYTEYSKDDWQFGDLAKGRAARLALKIFRSEARPPMKQSVGDLAVGRDTLRDRRVFTAQRLNEIVALIAQAPLTASLQSRIQSLSETDLRVLFERVTFYSEDFEHAVTAINQFAPSEGRIVIVNYGPEQAAENYSASLKRFFPERHIDVLTESELQALPPASVDTVVFNGLFANRARSAWPAAIELARSALKRNRPLISLDATARKSWEEQKPGGLELETLLRHFATTAYQNGSPMTEVELGLSLLMRREFFERSIKSRINQRQIPAAGETRGFGPHNNYGFRLSWLTGGELNWMHKE